MHVSDEAPRHVTGAVPVALGSAGTLSLQKQRMSWTAHFLNNQLHARTPEVSRLEVRQKAGLNARTT